MKPFIDPPERERESITHPAGQKIHYTKRIKQKIRHKKHYTKVNIYFVEILRNLKTILTFIHIFRESIENPSRGCSVEKGQRRPHYALQHVTMESS